MSHSLARFRRKALSILIAKRDRPPAYAAPILRLPIDVLQLLADQLPLSSAAALAITCRSLYITLGSQYCSALSTEAGREQRRIFLPNLNKDLKRFIFCGHCVRLLKGRQVLPEFLFGKPRDNHSFGCFIAEGGSYPDCTFRRKIILRHVQQAITYHLHGPGFGVPLKRFTLESRTVIKHSELRIQLMAVEARIVNGEFVVRTQRRIWFKPEELAEKLHVELLVCPHAGASVHKLNQASPNDPAWKIRTVCTHSHAADDPLCRRCSSWQSCPHCRAEFQAEEYLWQGGNSRPTIMVWSWTNYGSPGRFDDMEWLRHIPNHNLAVPPFIFEPGSIRRGFDSQPDPTGGLEKFIKSRIAQGRQVSDLDIWQLQTGQKTPAPVVTQS